MLCRRVSAVALRSHACACSARSRAWRAAGLGTATATGSPAAPGELALFKNAAELFCKDPQAMARFVGALEPGHRLQLSNALRGVAAANQAQLDEQGGEHVHDTFSQIDTNNDGTISRSEFRAFLSHPRAQQGAGADILLALGAPTTHAPPAHRDLALHAMNQAVPFVGFGFIDNALMIVFGEMIELKLGISLGLSTMAAAGLGNLLSDIAGVGLGGTIEAFCARLGLPVPRLSRQQAQMGRTRVAGMVGAAVGVAVGCLLGLLPLLFMDLPPARPHDHHHHHHHDDHHVR